MRKLNKDVSFPHSEYNHVLKYHRKYFGDKVLEVGSGDNWLKTQIKGCISVNNEPPTDIIMDLEKVRLTSKFKENSFDTVICTGVLEHLNNYQPVLDDMIKIARNFVIIALPNETNIVARLQFLLGNIRETEFGFNPPNRHKWVLNYNLCKRFFKDYKKVVEEPIYCRNVPHILPNLFAQNYLVILPKGKKSH